MIETPTFTFTVINRAHEKMNACETATCSICFVPSRPHKALLVDALWIIRWYCGLISSDENAIGIFDRRNECASLAMIEMIDDSCMCIVICFSMVAVSSTLPNAWRRLCVDVSQISCNRKQQQWQRNNNDPKVIKENQNKTINRMASRYRVCCSLKAEVNIWFA